MRGRRDAGCERHLELVGVQVVDVRRAAAEDHRAAAQL
jgi:hypothetical protein